MAGPATRFTQGCCAVCGGTLRWAEGAYICTRCGDEWMAETLRSNHKVAPGMAVYRFVWTGSRGDTDTTDLQTLTVVRANKKTVTVMAAFGSRFRLPYSEIVGYWDEDD